MRCDDSRLFVFVKYGNNSSVSKLAQHWEGEAEAATDLFFYILPLDSNLVEDRV